MASLLPPESRDGPCELAGFAESIDKLWLLGAYYNVFIAFILAAAVPLPEFMLLAAYSTGFLVILIFLDFDEGIKSPWLEICSFGPPREPRLFA